MMNEHWTSRLSEYLDNDLTPADRAAADAHLRSCHACTAMLDELRAVTARAHALSDHAPASDLWPAIAAAIGSDISPLSPRRKENRGGGRRFSFSVSQLAAAAVLLAAVSGGIVWTLGLSHAPVVAVAPAPPAAASSAPATSSTARLTGFTTRARRRSRVTTPRWRTSSAWSRPAAGDWMRRPSVWCRRTWP